METHTHFAVSSRSPGLNWEPLIATRPATVRAYDIVKKVNPNHGGIRTAEERAILFGQTAESIAKAAAAAR